MTITICDNLQLNEIKNMSGQLFKSIEIKKIHFFEKKLLKNLRIISIWKII